MARHGAISIIYHGTTFLKWLRGHVLMVQDYAYNGTEFREDLDLPLPAGAQRGNIGKKNTQDIDYFLILCFITFMDDNET